MPTVAIRFPRPWLGARLHIEVERDGETYIYAGLVARRSSAPSADRHTARARP